MNLTRRGDQHAHRAEDSDGDFANKFTIQERGSMDHGGELVLWALGFGLTEEIETPFVLCIVI
jgi:hypothetical protein